MKGTMSFQSGKKDMKIPGSVAHSSGYDIIPKAGSDLGPGNCCRSHFLTLNP